MWENKEEFQETFYLSQLRMKIFSELERYHPNLVANLSKEMHEKYIIKKAIYDDLLELLDDIQITEIKVKEYIRNKIEINKKLLKTEKSEDQLKALKLKIELLEDL
ncbi:MAG: hypothetical protein ACFE9T_10375 [Promethearchaeota archaeon]